MKNEVLILGLMIGLCCPSFADITPKAKIECTNLIFPAVNSFAKNDKNHEFIVSSKKKKPPEYVVPPEYKNQNRFWRFRRKYGTLTGFTPPINQTTARYYNSGHWWQNNNWQQIPQSTSLWENNFNNFNNNYLGSNYSSSPFAANSTKSRLKRFFNPNYNNHYQNSPGYNPYINGNYNNIKNNRYIPLYNGNGAINGFQNGRGLNLDTNTNSTGGATVTIID